MSKIETDIDQIMTALDICARPVDPVSNEVRRCRDCPFNDRGCIVILMLSVGEIMRKAKPAIVEYMKRDHLREVTKKVGGEENG